MTGVQTCALPICQLDLTRFAGNGLTICQLAHSIKQEQTDFSPCCIGLKYQQLEDFKPHLMI